MIAEFWLGIKIAMPVSAAGTFWIALAYTERRTVVDIVITLLDSDPYLVIGAIGIAIVSTAIRFWQLFNAWRLGEEVRLSDLWDTLLDFLARTSFYFLVAVAFLFFGNLVMRIAPFIGVWARMTGLVGAIIIEIMYVGKAFVNEGTNLRDFINFVKVTIHVKEIIDAFRRGEPIEIKKTEREE